VRKSVVLSVFIFPSDNLYGHWFVFFRECEFDNTDMEGNPAIECLYVSGVLNILL
jgi:hypothetical protein